MDEKNLSGFEIASEQTSIDGSGDGLTRRRNMSMNSSNDKAEISSDHGLLNEKQNQRKISSILLAANLRDYDKLASLATSHGGYINDETRRAAWPILLGCPTKSDERYKEKSHDVDRNEAYNAEKCNADDNDHKDIIYQEWQTRPSHSDEDQIKLDVNRAFVYYPLHRTDAELDARKAALESLIVAVLRKHPSLHYFQGYHDIASVLLLVLDGSDDERIKSKYRHRKSNSSSMTSINGSGVCSSSTFDVDETDEAKVSEAIALALARLSLLRIRDFMLPSLDAALAQLALLPAILGAADQALARHLTGMQPFYALAGTLTMYAHEIQSYGDIARLFDYLLAREAVLSIYLFAATLLRRRKLLLELSDPADLHAILSHLPSPLDLESLIAESHNLYTAYPPCTLPGSSFNYISSPAFSSNAASSLSFPFSFPFPIPFCSGWSSIPPSSALRTTRDLPGLALQSTRDGEMWLAELEEQVKQRKGQEERWIAAQQRLRAWRRPALGVGMAVAVAVLAVAVAGAGRRSGGGNWLGGHLPL